MVDQSPTTTGSVNAKIGADKSDVKAKVEWAQEAALTLVREAIARGGSVDTARIFKLAASPHDGLAVTNIMHVTSVLISHISTLLTMAGGGIEQGQALVDQMLATNEQAWATQADSEVPIG